MNQYRLACWQVSVLALWNLTELWRDNYVFEIPVTHTTHLLNELWNSSDHALVVVLILQCVRFECMISLDFNHYTHMLNEVLTRKLPKICLPSPAHYFETKDGRGHLLYLACICPLPPFLAIFIIHKVNNQDNCCGFLKSGSYDRQAWWWWWWGGVAQKERIFRNLQYIYIYVYTWQEDRKSFLKSFWSSCSRCCESTSPARRRVSQQCNFFLFFDLH